MDIPQPGDRVRFKGRYVLNDKDMTHVPELERIPKGCEGVVVTLDEADFGVIHVSWDVRPSLGARRIDASCVEHCVAEEEIKEAINSIHDSFTSHLEELASQAEAEAGEQVLEFTIVKHDGQWTTKCPSCGGFGTINEVDTDVRWNSLGDFEPSGEGGFTCVATQGDGGGYESSGFICETCCTNIDSPEGFEIGDWI